ncbi:hypothetical protein NP493_1525g00036 [Ridgeia piscesae]|uniref:G-protein coupled receptors family 1 profile domain-containing protein n=1 Tax=Ridgeia piscesae TaxID=27915 RepID=A0AAD9K1I3_RIDPI|nr:hypothetical protein NP493_1525g00036 [Ridgeia piscesae]
MTLRTHWLDARSGRITTSSGVGDTETVTDFAHILTSANSTRIDENHWTQLTTDADTRQSQSYDNETTNGYPSYARFTSYFQYVYYVLLPTIIVTGICGNMFTIRVMLAKHFRSTCVSVFLTALALSDTVVIVVSTISKRFFRYMIRVDVRSFSETGCWTFFWTYRTSKMLSSWIVVFVSVERFVAVCLPLRMKTVCTKRVAYVSTVVTLLICSSFNAFRSWLDTTIVDGTCVTNSTHRKGYTTVVEYVLLFSIITYALAPAVIMMVANAFTVTSLWRSRRKVHAQTSAHSSTAKMASFTARMTAMLLATNAAFVVLVMPVSITHLVLFFRQQHMFESTEPAIQVALLFEQLNYSVNFFLWNFEKFVIE